MFLLILIQLGHGWITHAGIDNTHSYAKREMAPADPLSSRLHHQGKSLEAVLKDSQRHHLVKFLFPYSKLAFSSESPPPRLNIKLSEMLYVHCFHDFFLNHNYINIVSI